MAEARQPLPWATGPTGAGSRRCEWCDRDINLPALPCSVKPVAGLAEMKLGAGVGQRCQYELATRRPEHF
jgi:hypothetical protein